MESEDDAVAQLVDLVPGRKVPKHGLVPLRRGPGRRRLGRSRSSTPTTPALRRLAVFDVLVNNADRKGGHILSSEGHLFGIDHGVTFNVENKLRTLLWGWGGSELTERERDLVRRARDDAPGRARRAARRRARSTPSSAAPTVLLDRNRLPRPRGQWPSIPWPPF